jgi:hypothetical protein
MTLYGPDIYTEQAGELDTLSHLGPLSRMAGVWMGERGVDSHPVASGSEENAYTERYELQPIDRQTNGPQLFYGLRYHIHIVKPGEVETFHDQVGYWLWEPDARAVTFTLAIPRGQVLLASGNAEADATEFELKATLGSEVNGIVSNPFLNQAFRTLSYRIRVSVHSDDTWSYESEAILAIAGRVEPFSHVDRNTLTRIHPPQRNPMASTV